MDCFGRLSEDSSCRVVLLTGSGKHFTSGIRVHYFTELYAHNFSYMTGLDLVDFAPMFTSFQSGSHGDGGTDVARKAFLISQMVRPMQDSFTAIEKVKHIHGDVENHNCI